jgi:hypothetical protein
MPTIREEINLQECHVTTIIVLGPQASPPARATDTDRDRERGRRGRLRSQHDDCFGFRIEWTGSV